MPWDPIKLNDGREVPGIGFGTWKIPVGQTTVDQVDQAISVGFDHIDTAQAYRNEKEAGIAVHESGLKRENVFITTKYSGLDGLGVEESIRNSLKYLELTYVDLYLLHSPRLAVPDIPTIWKQFEAIKEQGLARNIGISNFNVDQVKTLLASAKTIPAANQIILHPYAYKQQKPIVEFCLKNGIAIEAYSPLIPVTTLPGGPVDAPLKKVASRLNVTLDQVLLAWAKYKGAIVLTSSSKKSRLEGYLNAGDIILTPEEIKAIDDAGARGAGVRSSIRKVTATLVAAAFLAACGYFSMTAFH